MERNIHKIQNIHKNSQCVFYEPMIQIPDFLIESQKDKHDCKSEVLGGVFNYIYFERIYQLIYMLIIRLDH